MLRHSNENRRDQVNAMISRLSEHKLRVYGFIEGYIASNGEAPTLAEIGQRFGLTSSGSVHQILTKLGQGQTPGEGRENAVLIMP